MFKSLRPKLFFLFLVFFLLKEKGVSQSVLPAKASDTQSLVQQLLSQQLGTRRFAFGEVVKAATGHKVLPVHKENAVDSFFIQAITEAANAAIESFNSSQSPIKGLNRINEASRFFEDFLRKNLHAKPHLSCLVPLNGRGRAQRSGYPDLILIYTDNAKQKHYAYLDPKLFEKRSERSSLRTFYYEPRTHTNKIQHDARHFLLGIAHDGHAGDWRFVRWHLCDLSSFSVRLKAEFQASNKDIYRPQHMLLSSEIEHKGVH